MCCFANFDMSKRHTLWVMTRRVPTKLMEHCDCSQMLELQRM